MQSFEGRGVAESGLARSLLDDGLRMEFHPGIAWSGSAGRRPGPAGGTDVWEVIRVLKGVESQVETSLRQSAELTRLTPERVRTAHRYYAEQSVEIESWFRRVDEAAPRANRGAGGGEYCVLAIIGLVQT